jgi:hypothetical protein
MLPGDLNQKPFKKEKEMKVLISNNPEKLTDALSEHPYTTTIEAEYGSAVVEGSLLTLAHHGERSHNPPPCVGGNIEDIVLSIPGIDPDSGYADMAAPREIIPRKEVVVGISHFDLDTLGGIRRVSNTHDFSGDIFEDLFWHIAGEVDTQGVHKLNRIKKDLQNRVLTENPTLSKEDFDMEWKNSVKYLHAWWAWSAENRLFPPRDGSVEDVTDFILKANKAIDEIFDDDPTLLEKGREWKAAQDHLNEESYINEKNGVILRRSSQFTNHLYITPFAHPAKAVIAFNEKTEAITLSFADPINGFSAAEIMKEHFGNGAGGHAGIAGTPRDRDYSFADAENFFKELAWRSPFHPCSFCEATRECAEGYANCSGAPNGEGWR